MSAGGKEYILLQNFQTCSDAGWLFYCWCRRFCPWG